MTAFGIRSFAAFSRRITRSASGFAVATNYGNWQFYRREYDNVAERMVWHTVQHDLPPLLAFAEKAIAEVQATAEPKEAAAKPDQDLV
jgi:hypothetical protein